MKLTSDKTCRFSDSSEIIILLMRFTWTVKSEGSELNGRVITSLFQGFARHDMGAESELIAFCNICAHKC